MSSASRGSGTRRRMKLRSRDCSRLTTSEIRWSGSSAIRSRLVASFTYGCRRMRECGYCRVGKLLEAARTSIKTSWSLGTGFSTFLIWTISTALSCGDPRCAGLLLPSLNVHADDEEPQDQRCRPEEAEGCKIGEQTVSERG